MSASSPCTCLVRLEHHLPSFRVAISVGMAYRSISVLLTYNPKRTKQRVSAEKLEAMKASV